MKTFADVSRLLAVAVVAAAGVARAQSGVTMNALGQRLERLEQQNTELLQEVRLLRSELEGLRRASPPVPVAPAAAGGVAGNGGTADGAVTNGAAPAAADRTADSVERRVGDLEEKVDLQEGRLNEHDQVKVESSQRVPVRLTGMALFNAFTNSHHTGGADNPLTASTATGPVNSGGTMRQSVIGLEFDGPEAVGGGKIHGAFLMDLFNGSSDVLNNTARVRIASIEAQWATRGFLVGQEKPIFAPREPNSLAQVGISPLTSAGNLWRWRPQVRFEQRVGLGSGQDLNARIGVSQTYEDGAIVPSEFASTLEHYRPALEGRFQFAHHFDDNRRVEIAPGFHLSTTHVAHTSVSSSVFSIDWFVNPLRRLEFTGNLFTGQNLANLGGGGVRQGFTFLASGPGGVRVIPVRSRGGWAQVTFIATPRLSLNLYGGQDDPNNRDLLPSGIAKNLAYAANIFYKIAPNVVVGAEASQVRTQLMSGQRPINNHYDLAVAYLF